MDSPNITALPNIRCELGEGARWIGGALHWVDIPAGTLWRLSPDGQHEIVLQVSEPLSAVAPCADGRWIVACGKGFAVHDGTSLRWLHRPELGKPMRMNDGCADPAGRFLAGSMSLTGQTGAGSLYRLELDGSLSTLIRGLTTPNGPAFSPDGVIMYVADTRARRIDAYDYDPNSGRMSAPRTFVQLDRHSGSPDGMIVDLDGHLWSAGWGAGAVRRYAPDGTLVQSITVPARQPTSCCFGGVGLDVLHVTSGYVGLADPTELDGAVFAISGLGTRGVPATVTAVAPC